MYFKDQRHGSRCRERRRKKQVLLITAKNARAGGERAEKIRKVGYSQTGKGLICCFEDL